MHANFLIGALVSIRSEKRNAKRKDSADLIEFMSLAGVGNAEVGNLTWGDVDFDGGKITLFRQKTRRGFQAPLYPQLNSLLERRKGESDRRPKEPVFPHRTARGALNTACERLGYPHFEPQSLQTHVHHQGPRKGHRRQGRRRVAGSY